MSTTRILKVPWLVFNGHTSLRLDLYIYMQEYVCMLAMHQTMVSCPVLHEHRKKVCLKADHTSRYNNVFLVLRVRHRRHKWQNTPVSIACLLCFHSNPSSLVTRKIFSSGISRATPWIAAWETNQTDFLACGYCPNLPLGPCILKEIRENQCEEWDRKAARILSKFKMAASSLKFLAH